MSREGFVVIGSGSSVILSAEGEIILSVLTNYTAVNVNWAGGELDELWIVGVGL